MERIYDTSFYFELEIETEGEEETVCCFREVQVWLGGGNLAGSAHPH